MKIIISLFLENDADIFFYFMSITSLIFTLWPFGMPLYFSVVKLHIGVYNFVIVIPEALFSAG